MRVDPAWEQKKLEARKYSKTQRLPPRQPRRTSPGFGAISRNLSWTLCGVFFANKKPLLCMISLSNYEPYRPDNDLNFNQFWFSIRFGNRRQGNDNRGTKSRSQHNRITVLTCNRTGQETQRGCKTVRSKRNENYLSYLFIYLRSLSDISQDRID